MIAAFSLMCRRVTPQLQGVAGRKDRDSFFHHGDTEISLSKQWISVSSVSTWWIQAPPITEKV